MIEWHDFSKEGFPEKEGKYLCLDKYKISGEKTLYPIILRFTKNMHRFDDFDFPDEEEDSSPGFVGCDSDYGFAEWSVIYWAEINYPDGGDNG